MGEELEEEQKFGFDCLTCYAAGQAPKYLWANISGIVICWPGIADSHGVPNGCFKMTNKSGCIWRYQDDYWTVAYQSAAAWSSMKAQHLSQYFFYKLIMAPCSKFFINGLVCGHPNYGHLGECNIYP